MALAPMLLTGQSQYPVRATSVLFPPYSLRLHDYATTTEEKLQVQLLMTDLLEPSHDVVLQFWLESGTGDGVVAHSAPVVSGFPQINLQPGVPVTLSNVDLRALFEYNNLTGISPRQYARALPQGLYRFCFQVFDKYTGRTLSQKSCASVYLQQYDPPLLTLPTDSEIIYQQNEVQNILFQWMPRQLAPNTSYVFTLKELWDLGQSPISGFLSSPVLWQEEVRTTSLYFGMDKVLLLPGKRYAWQVQAKSSNPALPGTTVSPSDDNGVYKNNGLSEIYYFDYAKPCVTPSFLTAQNKGRGKTEIRWSYSGAKPMNGYKVQYRRKRSSSQWEEVESYTEQVIIGNLAAATEYEYRVGSICGSLSQFTPSDVSGHTYAYSGIQYFKTAGEDAEDRNYQCGVLPNVDLSNRTPLKGTLGVNSVFMAGDFPVTVLSSEGHGGTYSGEGYIEVPYLGDTKLKVSFNAIQLNSEFQLISGYLETSYDVNEKNVHDVDNAFGQFFGDVGVVEKTLDYEVSEVYYEEKTGTIVIKGNAGADNAYDEGEDTASVQTLPKGKDYQIKDKNGNIWTVDEKGNVTKGGKEAEGGATTAENTEGVSNTGSVEKFTSEGIKVRFSNAPNSKYAFEQPTRALSDAYKKLSGSYLPFKAVENQQEEPFLAQVEVSDTSVNLDSLVFKTSKGVEIPSKRVSGTTDFELTLKGRFNFAIEEVQAVIKQGKKYKVAGAFYLIHLSPRTVKLNLVPTEEGMNLSARIAELQAIYKKVAVDVEVTIQPVFSIASYLENGKLPSSDAFGDLSTYSEAERAIIHSYKSENEVGLEYYIFVTNVASSSGQSGYMRLNGQFGFVFEGGSARTIAHELGHGAFRLEHPFKQFRGLEKGDTDNLMDYSGGTAFSYPHWQQINDPKLKLYAFQGQEEGAVVIESFSGATARLIKNINCAINRGEKSVRLYFPIAQTNVKVSDLVSELNLAGSSCSKSSEVKITFYDFHNTASNANNDYVEDIFDLKNIKYDEKDYSITLKGEKYSLVIATVGEKQCVYRFVKNNLLGNLPITSINFKSLQELQYASFCDLEKMSIENRKEVLLKIKDETNWYNSSLKDSRQKITINIIATTPRNDAAELLSLFKENPLVFRTLYESIDDYKDEFIQEFFKLYLAGRIFIKDTEILGYTYSPGITELSECPFQIDVDRFFDALFGWFHTCKREISSEFISNGGRIAIYYRTYRGAVSSLHFNSPSQELEGELFDIVKFGSILDANPNVADVPLFLFKYLADKGKDEALDRDFSELGKEAIDVALLVFGLKELQGAAQILKNTVTARNVARLILGFADLTTLGLGEVCANSDSEFCESYKKYELYINMGLLSANVLNEFPQLYKNLKKGLDDPNLTQHQKDELRKILDGDGVGNIAGRIYRNVKYDDFIKSFKATEEQYKKAYKLWGEEKWDELYRYFKTNDLNGGWPPFYGAKSILKTERGKQLAGKVFDRFQGPGDITGDFASPVYRTQGIDDLYFTYDSRALKWNISEGTNYIKFKFRSNIPDDVIFEYGDVIPWFGRQGLGDQVKSSRGLKDLIDDGIIEIIEQKEFKGGQWK